MIKLRLFIIFIFLLQLGAANAVSFDCSKAKSYSEKLICSDRELSEQDDELYILYKEAKAKYSDKNEFKKITTSLWNEREKCKSEDCVRDWYETAKLKYSNLKKNTKSNSKIDNTQHEFLSAVLKAQKASKNVKNDMVLGGIKVERDLEICKVLREKEVKNWIGTVKLLDANKDGAGVLWVDIADNVTLKTLNNDAPELGIYTLIQPGSELFRKASNLEIGDKVTFSGVFLYTDKQCAAETSITLYGGVSRPEFVFRFTSIEKLSKKTAEKTVTDNEMQLGIDSLIVACELVGKKEYQDAKLIIRQALQYMGGDKDVPQEVIDDILNYYRQHDDLSKKTCQSHTISFLQSIYNLAK